MACKTICYYIYENSSGYIFYGKTWIKSEDPENLAKKSKLRCANILKQTLIVQMTFKFWKETNRNF